MTVLLNVGSLCKLTISVGYHFLQRSRTEAAAETRRPRVDTSTNRGSYT